MKTSKQALASHLNMDVSDLSDYNYQYGKFTKSVYNFDFGMYCSSKNNTTLPQPTGKNQDRLIWEMIPDSFCNNYGWLIFKAINRP